MIKANNPDLRSWIDVKQNSDFPIQNIPFGIFKIAGEQPRAATRIGDQVVDLAELERSGFFKSELQNSVPVFDKANLNDFIKLGKEVTRKVRDRISELFAAGNDEIRDNEELKSKVLYRISEVEMLLPVRVCNYTDFYSSKEHATNVGTMFRGKDNALMPNWLHIPVGYHGRASSIIVSGVDIHRPKGQQKPDDADSPVFGPSKLMDFELEMAFVTYPGKPLGESISTEEAESYIFGMVLFNDWSARDIQKWEYVPLGPFLGKNFASSVSPWIVTLDALEPLRTKGPDQDPKVLPYLEYDGEKSYDINLEVYIQPERGEESKVCTSNFKYMYWTMAQQLAHHTVNGCNILDGDMYGSGTISGPTPDSYGSMLELSWKGTNPVKLSDGSERKFIQDNDTVVMRGYGEKNGLRIGFGEVRSKLLPAK